MVPAPLIKVTATSVKMEALIRNTIIGPPVGLANPTQGHGNGERNFSEYRLLLTPDAAILHYSTGTFEP